MNMSNGAPEDGNPQNPHSPSTWPPPVIVDEQTVQARGKAWLFDDRPLKSRLAVWRWWEIRRLVYNAVLLIIGLCSCLLWGLMIAVSPGSIGSPFVLLVIAVPIHAVMANVCCTLGPIVDMFFYVGRPRVKLFKSGFIFAIVLTAAPGALGALACLFTLIAGKKI
jgi:hypothetical protein